jgi:hypothetical protein
LPPTGFSITVSTTLDGVVADDVSAAVIALFERVEVEVEMAVEEPPVALMPADGDGDEAVTVVVRRMAICLPRMLQRRTRLVALDEVEVEVVAEEVAGGAECAARPAADSTWSAVLRSFGCISTVTEKLSCCSYTDVATTRLPPLLRSILIGI